MKNRFEHTQTVSEIKKLFRNLALENHPDLHPQDEFEKWNGIMREINKQYLEALKKSDQQVSVGQDGKQHTYYYNQETEQAIVDKISELINLKMEGVTIWIVGTWIWVEGNTYPYKDQLGKGLGLDWIRSRKMWSFKTTKWHRRSNPGSFDYLKSKYGAATVNQDETKAIS